MIKNERQYRITKAQAAKFEAALESFLAEAANNKTPDPNMPSKETKKSKYAFSLD
jgi:hypothetical protein